MSVVVGVRIPEKLKKEMEELGIDYSKEVREYLERRVREEKTKSIIKKLNDLQSRMKRIDDNLAPKIVREEREAR